MLTKILKIKDRIFPPKIEITNMCQNDYAVVELLFLDGVNSGSYDKKLILDKVAFNNMIKAIVDDKASRDMYNRIVCTFACKINNKTIGFLTLAVNYEDKEAEIWHYSILENYRNRGYGKIFINALEKIIANNFGKLKLFARCHKDNSIAIKKILIKCNFYESGINRQGYIFYRQK